MNTFSMLDYGAIPGAQGLQTEAIQKAIDARFLAGGGEVTIPAGDYRTGGLRLRSNMTLHLLADAHLFGSRDPEDYMAFLKRPAEGPSRADRRKSPDIDSALDARSGF